MTPSVSWASRRAKDIPRVTITHNVSFEGNSSDFCWHADSHATRFCDESLMTVREGVCDGINTLCNC